MKKDLPAQTFLLEIEYDGLLFGGWQVQSGRRIRTIQGDFEKALRRILHKRIRVAASGRTDRGVHACGQCVSFFVPTTIPALALRKALNSILPEDIRVKNVWRMRPGFNARYDCLTKIYRYRIRTGETDSVFSRNYSWWIRDTLSVPRMRQAAKLFIGEKDFSSFANEKDEYETCERRIMSLSVVKQHEIITIAIEGTGFLRKMVRNIVGFLADVGRGKRPLSSVRTILKNKDRSCIGMPAPARGLYLWKVRYPKKYFLKCQSKTSLTL